jgi:DNA-binding MarR family transcriptional regulator
MSAEWDARQQADGGTAADRLHAASSQCGSWTGDNQACGLGAGATSPEGQLDADIVAAFGEMIEQMMERAEAVARRFELPSFCLKALHMLNAPMAMKELGQRIHCDPSFVTSIADMLDSHGLGLREPDSRDRRVKRLRLTPKGFELRERVERELFARLPWTDALELSERKELLRLLRKMLAAGRGQHAPEARAESPSARAPRTPARTGAARAASSPAGTATTGATGTPDTSPVLSGGSSTGEVT